MTPLTEQVNQLIKASGATRSETAVPVSWILVTEWVGDDGSSWLEEYRTVDLAPWRREGILNYVLNQPQEVYEDELDDE